MSPHRPLTADDGFTYIGVLILIAIIGLVSTSTLYVGKIQQRRAAEEELLNIGMEFRQALIAYANSTPFGFSRSPSSLQDLLKDPRFPNPRRYLRKLYIDPMTGKAEWATVRTIDGRGIIGVHSLSAEKPVKIGNFPAELAALGNRSAYRDWKFMVPDEMQLNPAGLDLPEDASLANPGKAGN
ncbi:type II secretion system protein [Herbaspirillum sp. YR522]|uniref:type II secretion system protein n=1 Tax=Herbaspirillum sp. YR522 TaxID=1144342 RepID=UPI00026F7FA1|nr:type II secretion system protein [Herbaspirillum sp. YR522]EJN03259.1 type II secretory pathway, pseudopilin PulG [Herbaspirillum sp. YR522]